MGGSSHTFMRVARQLVLKFPKQRQRGLQQVCATFLGGGNRNTMAILTRYFSADNIDKSNDSNTNKGKWERSFDGDPPEEFYDDDVESEKEFMDMISAVARGNGDGLGGLTTHTESLSYDEIEKLDDSNIPTGIVES